MAARIESRFGITPRLIPSDGGVFEVVFGGARLFSKKAQGRFPEDDEVFAGIAQRL
ncbi:MAG: Rdx family protein [Candidatus Krumholzibacteriota bacterium]|nr:Rdx family protein [Candidatus Krumholzibacteriota bacterium]